MKIALKAIKYSAFASQETSCYSANLYVNGKKIGTVSNAGHGGCDDFHGDRSAYINADKWCRANLPKWKLETDDDRPDQEYETDLEVHCGDLLTNWMVTKEYKAKIKTRVLMHDPDKGGIYEVQHRGQIDQTAKAVKAQHPNVTILNALPLEEAIALYRAA